MKKIKLTQGKYALVRDVDFEYLNQWKWHLNGYAGSKYVKRRKYLGKINDEYKYEMISMSRLIMGLKKGDTRTVDHINGNKKDNRKCNLRICTQFQNCLNRRKLKKKSSQYKGVSWHIRDKIYEANIRINKKLTYLGRSNNESYCARLYDEAATKYFGEFAKLNFPKQMATC